MGLFSKVFGGRSDAGAIGAGIPRKPIHGSSIAALVLKSSSSKAPRASADVSRELSVASESDAERGLLPSHHLGEDGFNRPRPDRLFRRQLLQTCYHTAFRNVLAESLRPLWQGRLALVGLLLVQGLRAAAWLDGELPGAAVNGLHALTIVADVIALGVAAPLFFCQTLQGCVRGGRAGLVLTLIFALTCVELGALFSYCFVGAPRPFSPGRKTVLVVAEAYLTLWECTLAASTALQVCLLISCWRIYRELRRNGLYPLGTPPAGFGQDIQEVSVFEMLCEVEDVNRIKSGKCALCCQSQEGGYGPLEDGCCVESVVADSPKKASQKKGAHRGGTSLGYI